MEFGQTREKWPRKALRGDLIKQVVYERLLQVNFIYALREDTCYAHLRYAKTEFQDATHHRTRICTRISYLVESTHVSGVLSRVS